MVLDTKTVKELVEVAAISVVVVLMAMLAVDVMVGTSALLLAKSRALLL